MSAADAAPRWAIMDVLREQRLDQLYDADAVVMGRFEGAAVLRLSHAMALQWAELRAFRDAADLPLEMILHCPVCHAQHIDEVDEERNPGWLNPIHSSHTCLSCGTVWRPCARPTCGVASLAAHGRSDTWPARGRRAVAEAATGGVLAVLAAPLEAMAEQDRATAKAAVAAEKAHPAGKTAPANCRDRMRRERKAGPRVGCGGCNPANKHKFTCPYLGDE